MSNEKNKKYDIENIIESPARLKILKILALNKELSISQVIKSSGMNSPDTIKYLHILKNSDLIAEKIFGRTRTFRFNFKNLNAISLVFKDKDLKREERKYRVMKDRMKKDPVQKEIFLKLLKLIDREFNFEEVRFHCENICPVLRHLRMRFAYLLNHRIIRNDKSASRGHRIGISYTFSDAEWVTILKNELEEE